RQRAYVTRRALHAFPCHPWHFSRFDIQGKPMLTIFSLTPLHCASVLAMSLLMVTSAHAHRSFLVPSSTVLADTGQQWVTVDAARGNDLFFFNHNAMPIEGLRISAPDGHIVAPSKLERFRYRHVFDLEVKQPGTWQIAVVEDGLRARWKEQGKEKRWNGTRANYAQSVPAQATDLTVSHVQSRIETFV